jgi:hypothetical protein
MDEKRSRWGWGSDGVNEMEIKGGMERRDVHCAADVMDGVSCIVIAFPAFLFLSLCNLSSKSSIRLRCTMLGSLSCLENKICLLRTFLYLLLAGGF